MELKELAAQYRESAEKCRARVKQLRAKLNSEACGGQEMLLLRRRINMLIEMAGDTATIAKYLETYYQNGGQNDVQNNAGAGNGVSEHAAADARYGSGCARGADGCRGNLRGIDAAPGADGEIILYGAAQHAGDCGYAGYQRFHREQNAEIRPHAPAALPALQQQGVAARGRMSS